MYNINQMYNIILDYYCSKEMGDFRLPGGHDKNLGEGFAWEHE